MSDLDTLFRAAMSASKRKAPAKRKPKKAKPRRRARGTKKAAPMVVLVAKNGARPRARGAVRRRQPKLSKASAPLIASNFLKKKAKHSAKPRKAKRKRGKLTGAAKAAFLARMAKGRRK